MYKRILVPTDGSDSAAIASHYAIALAKQYQASILGLYVVDAKLLEGPFLRDISASLGTAPYVNYQGNITMLLEERGKASLEQLEEDAKAAGVPCEVEQLTGVVATAILEKSELTDLVVMGRAGEHNEWLEGLLGSTTEAVVRRAKRPVLITGADTPKNKNFLLAYDGTSHAREALQTSVELAEHGNIPFHLLYVGKGNGEAILAEAEKYLSAHAVEVAYEYRDGDAGEVIIEYAREIEAGLIVMGAYGHSKVRELVVGSTTAYVMHHTPCPVLLTR